MSKAIMSTEHLSEDLKNVLENKCSCGYPKPLVYEIVSNTRTFICPNCGRDTTFFDLED